MTALYNEIDPFAAQWTRNLIAAGHVAPGVVDERSIRDLTPADVSGHGQRHFFAGIAVWSYALRLAGVADDADVWTGSCPCQPFSSAGRGGGFDDERHLWPAWFSLIRECRPAIVFGEQVARGAGPKWADRVRCDLEAAGYAVGFVDLCASLLGFPRRERLFFVAYADADGKRDVSIDAEMASVSAAGNLVGRELGRLHDMVPTGDGASDRVGQRGPYGNAINGQLAAVFIGAALGATP